MFIVTYKNENQVGWSESVEQFQTIKQAENWISENLPLGTQKFRTGEYDILKICDICGYKEGDSSESELIHRYSCPAIKKWKRDNEKLKI